MRPEPPMKTLELLLLLVITLFYGATFIMSLAHYCFKKQTPIQNQFNSSSKKLTPSSNPWQYNQMGESSHVLTIQQSEGGSYRQYFGTLLSFACLFRTVTLVFMFSQQDLLNSFWYRTVLLYLPSLIFITAFSVFVYYFTRLAAETSFVVLLLIIASNIFCYLGFLTVSIYHSSKENNSEYKKAVSGLLAIQYLILAMVFVNYGTRVSIRVDQEGEELWWWRIVLLTTGICSCFLFSSVYHFLYTWNLISSFNPEGMNFCLFFVMMTFLTDLIPCSLIMITNFSQSDQNPMHLMEQDYYSNQTDSDEEFGSFNPNLKEPLIESTYDMSRNQDLKMEFTEYNAMVNQTTA